MCTVASSGGAASGGESALFSKLGGAFFGGPNSPQKVIANVRGLANRLTGAIPDTGRTTSISVNTFDMHRFNILGERQRGVDGW